MSAEDDDAELTPEELIAIGADDPESGARAKRKITGPLKGFLDEFHRNAQGLDGAELQAEVDRLVDRILEAEVGVAPMSLKDELRRRLRDMLESDPTLGAILADLRAAAERDARER